MENLIEYRYNRLTEFLKRKFGERTLKICIDGGFTCPNRDGKKGTCGCIFCSEAGSGDHLNRGTDISEQVKNYFSSYKSTRANKFIAYFQNYTNTYSDVETLRNKYRSALIDDRIVALAIATRPDCITEDIVKMISEFTKTHYVWVELGLQTCSDITGNLINRCYSSEQFTKAVKLLNKYHIDVVTHIMVGLPGEDFESIKETVKFINLHHIQGIKIHSTYVVKNTKLEELYRIGKYIPLDLDEYINSVVYILTHISKDVVIHRISGDAPKSILIAPEWNTHKKLVLNGVHKLLNDNNLYQGIYYNES